LITVCLLLIPLAHLPPFVMKHSLALPALPPCDILPIRHITIHALPPISTTTCSAITAVRPDTSSMTAPMVPMVHRLPRRGIPDLTKPVNLPPSSYFCAFPSYLSITIHGLP
jgi:hypothetical protein